MPPLDMIQNCRKRKQFFDRNNKIIPSKNSRIPEGTNERSCTIREALFSEEDADFLNFIEVSRKVLLFSAVSQSTLPKE